MRFEISDCMHSEYRTFTLCTFKVSQSIFSIIFYSYRPYTSFGRPDLRKVNGGSAVYIILQSVLAMYLQTNDVALEMAQQRSNRAEEAGTDLLSPASTAPSLSLADKPITPIQAAFQSVSELKNEVPPGHQRLFLIRHGETDLNRLNRFALSDEVSSDDQKDLAGPKDEKGICTIDAKF